MNKKVFNIVVLEIVGISDFDEDNRETETIAEFFCESELEVQHIVKFLKDFIYPKAIFAVSQFQMTNFEEVFNHFMGSPFGNKIDDKTIN